ncbi:stage III sporulation protein AE [Amphibacillus marinus]|uniref:Stage III sporulation protein AE n=1 Tax=Amphibacillus marinus TaxID=872970 RepID=A0A1H8NLJ0_9BACI|nr:stage III sporulation protein AE [Amphibacillus marinus]SEO30490.1 stage III sporulation protein AE [Amphibacillus marinus]
MKKLITLIGIIVLNLTSHTLPVYAEQEVQQPEIQLFDQLETEPLTDFWQELRYDYEDYLPEINRLSVKEMITNSSGLSITSLFRAFFELTAHELMASSKLLGQLIVISLISAFLKNMQASFQSESVSTVANLVLIILLTTLAIQSFTVVGALITDVVSQIHSFVLALLPLLLGLMAMMGGILSASFFHPVIITFLNITVVITDKVVLPLIYFSLLLHLVSLLNKTFQLTKLADLLRQVALGLLVICLSVFLTVLSAQGAISSVQDGLTVKTTQFVTNNFIPVVGRMFSEATDTIFATTQILKNGLGVFGFIFILLMVAVPIIKVAIIGLSYKLVAAILQPIGEVQIVKSATAISEHIFYLLAALLVVSFMFVMTIVILLVASNLTLMMR